MAATSGLEPTLATEAGRDYAAAAVSMTITTKR
jgi:hypothetical protein